MYRMSSIYLKIFMYKMLTMPKTVNTDCPFKCHSLNHKMLEM